jgi:hypothetical protein
VRVTLLVLLALVLALAVALAYQRLLGKTEDDRDARGPESAWSDRVTPVVLVAPGPLPKGSVIELHSSNPCTTGSPTPSTRHRN